jgi:tetratricopeptide (TPR) repeat protein
MTMDHFSRRAVGVLAVLVTLAASGIADAGRKVSRPRGAHDYEGYSELVAHEAQEAMNAGDYAKARKLYLVLIRIDDADPFAHRQLGAVAMALGDLKLAEGQLAKADVLGGAAEDPEAWYLRGEALYGLGRADEAQQEHDRALRTLGKAPEGRLERLWLARIYARRGDLSRSGAIYREMTPPLDKPADEEVALNHAEAYVLNKDWEGAEQILREFLRREPQHQRAREMLAWALESQGDVDGEVEERERLAGWTGAVHWVHYGRALERRRDYEGALKAYRQARRIQGRSADQALDRAIDRMENRVSVEVGATTTMRSDPTGEAMEWRAGVMFPIDGGVSIALVGAHETASGGLIGAEGSRIALEGGILIGLWRDADAEFRVNLSGSDVLENAPTGVERRKEVAVGTSVRATTPATRFATVDIKGDLRSQWLESADTIRGGGYFSGGTGHVYLKPFGHRLIIDTGAQVRDITLAAFDADLPDASAQQQLWFVGADVVLWTDPANSVRGEVVDRDMLRPTYLADALVASHRHYESFVDADDEFLQRLQLVRASIDELSFNARKVLGSGILGLEARGGIGWDWARELSLWRVGGGLELAATAGTRLSLSYDVATESTAGFVGQRRSGWITFHVDL